jgi:Icc-related predicted phosphoesterase
MRLLITADLHYNHPKSRALAEELIDRMNADHGDVLVVVGDTAVADGDSLEACLSRFNFTGPKLFVAGNHELWTSGDDSHAILTEQLPQRVRKLGWHWLETEPFVVGDIAIVGSVGWYDYSFAVRELGIPRRFYAAKVSPGAAERLSQFADLFEITDDILPIAREVVARWNDGKFVKLHRSDDDFLQEILDRLANQLMALAGKKQVIACVHHLPFRDLLPPPHSAQWDFAKAFLGSDRIGQLLLAFENVRHVFCGHSHMPMTADIGGLNAVNIGTGYRWKTYKMLEISYECAAKARWREGRREEENSELISSRLRVRL